jgi:hypothetical protein
MTTTVDEIVIRESGEIVLAEKTEVGNTFAYSRRSINPGDDYSLEVPRVVLVCDLVHNEDYLETPINPINSLNWTGFYDGLIISQTYNHLLGLTVPYPSISGVMAVMGVAILQGQSDPSNPSRLAALQAAVSAILSVLNALEIPLTSEQLAEVRGLLDSNGFEAVNLS